MNGKTCKTCKWWRWYKGDWGDCVKTETQGMRGHESESKAFAIDGEGYYAVLETHKDFGCVQWEARGEVAE